MTSTGSGLPKSSLHRIKHIVVLMLENRSFDSLLGRLYPKSETFDGLSGTESNPGPDGQPVFVNSVPGATPEIMSYPDPNPGEHWEDINEQLFSTPFPVEGATPTMDGFVKNYMTRTDRPPEEYDPKQIMHYFTPEQVPVISQLARSFAVSDRWFASAPCQTWPNRFFVHTATANGYQNNSPPHFPYRMPTVFNQIDDADISRSWKKLLPRRLALRFSKKWIIYYDGVPNAANLSKLWRRLGRFKRYAANFKEAASTGTLPAYTFIEPKYFPIKDVPSDMHPPGDVTAGERLIADVYNALRNGPAWKSTLLVIIFDEHGGCYDHVPPPAAVPPSKTPTTPFNFGRYGVRIPAVFVSPYIKPGTVLRPPGATPFDHTSVIATLRKWLGLGPPLTDRDAVAPDFGGVLSLRTPDNMGPDRVEALPVEEFTARMERMRRKPMTDLQKAQYDLSGALPESEGDAETKERRLAANPLQSTDTANMTAGEAGDIADRRVRKLMDRVRS
jgi:phospholipase C